MSVPVFNLGGNYMSTTNNNNFYDFGYKPTNTYQMPAIFDTPKTIYDYLNSHLYGHIEYKKVISTFIWKAIHGRTPGTILVAGESGSGKSEMIRILSKIYDSNINIVDGSTVVPHGYKGTNHLSTQLSVLDFNNEIFPPILVIDEFDKMLNRGNGSWSETGLLSELLKFLEGGLYNCGTDDKPRYVRTEKLSVILLGSFSSLTDQVQSYTIGFGCNKEDNSRIRSTLTKDQILSQLTPELQGRISQIVILNNFTEDDYLKILKDSNYSPIVKLQEQYGVKFFVSESKYYEIAREAFNSLTGVRSMNNKLEAYLDEELFNNPDVKEITIE